jgi:hypothetical protein
MKGSEVRSLNASIDSLKGVNEELKVRGLVFSSRAGRSLDGFTSASVCGHVGRHRGWQKSG